MNDLAENRSNVAVFALFVDVVSILATACQKEYAVAAVQLEFNKVDDWSQKWKLNLNAGKSECCPFPIWSKNSKWRTSFTIGGNQIKVNDTLRLLDVILDQSLSFNVHIKHIRHSLSSPGTRTLQHPWQ